MVRALLLHDLIAPTPKLRIEDAVVPIIVSTRHTMKTDSHLFVKVDH